MNGILLIDKPSGWTSFDVVAKVRSTLRHQLTAPTDSRGPDRSIGPHSLPPAGRQGSQLTARAPKVRVGHTGTLDPLATGLLVIVVGSYTKRAQEFSKLDKTYEVTMKLGEISTTGDAEGIITSYHNFKLSRMIVMN